MRPPHKALPGLLVAVFVAAFFLRAYHPISRPAQWRQRARAFNEALDERDWASTYQKYHPGLTTMAVSGTALRLYEATRGTSAQAIMSWGTPSYATASGQRTAVGVMGLALVIAGIVVASGLALRQLDGWPLALAAAGLMAFSPFYLAEGRVLHVDALVSALMLLSALLLLVSLERGQRRYLVLSGFVGGLATLTKTPSLFLIPFTGLALLAYLVKRLRADWAKHAGGRGRWLVGETWRRLVAPGLVWLVCMAVPYLLWPAMWVQPATTLQSMFKQAGTRGVERSHSMRFFAGQTGSDHPPLSFYPVVMAFKSSFVTFTLVLVALGQYTLWRKRARLPLPRLAFWLLVAYVFFFTVQMTIASNQVHRYILPASLALEVLAAVGLVGLIELGRRALADRDGAWVRALPTVLVGLAVGLQALIALPYAPDYGAHHNHLLGGNRVAVNVIEISGQNEGILHVADYLSTLPNTESLQVGVAPYVRESLKQYFPGEIAYPVSAEDDYHLFAIGPLQRRLDLEGWYSAWEVYGGAAPQVLVEIDGVAYMWLYATRPPNPYYPVIIRRGGGVGFIVLAWVWALALAGAIAWALRREARRETGKL